MNNDQVTDHERDQRISDSLTKAVSDAEKHLESYQAKLAAGDKAGDKLFNFCSVYNKAKPILKVARILLFWKPSFQKVIDEVIAAGDLACPVA